MDQSLTLYQICLFYENRCYTFCSNKLYLLKLTLKVLKQSILFLQKITIFKELKQRNDLFLSKYHSII